MLESALGIRRDGWLAFRLAIGQLRSADSSLRTFDLIGARHERAWRLAECRSGKSGLPTVARVGKSDSPPTRFALRWATFACIRERRLVRKRGFDRGVPT